MLINFHSEGTAGFRGWLWQGFVEFNLVLVRSQVAGQLLDNEFQPTVTATCKGGQMTIRVNLNQSFVGAVHARDFRTPQCMAPGNGSTHATLAINLLALKGAPDYCGVLVNKVSTSANVHDFNSNLNKLTLFTV